MGGNKREGDIMSLFLEIYSPTLSLHHEGGSKINAAFAIKVFFYNMSIYKNP